MTSSQNTSHKAPISEDLLATLKADIDSRRIEDGMQRLASCSQIFQTFDPTMKNAAVFVGTVAQWCDIGFGDLSLIKRLIGTYTAQSRLHLSITDYIQVRLAEGMVAMSDEMLDDAIGHFEIVLKLATETNSWDVIPIVSHWMARCQRKKGLYDSALVHIKKAQEVQRAHGHVQNEGPARVLESLLLFEKGEAKRAIDNLRIAQNILNQTDDYETLGNIQSTYGRIMQRELRYGQAIKHYQSAIELFQKSKTKFDNVARAIVDMSFARLHTARHLRRNIEGYSDQHQKNARHGPRRATLVNELSTLYDVILADLSRAAQIYHDNPNARGISRVHLVRGYLYLDTGELDLATEEAAKAYQSAESKKDPILMGSARNLQCMVENAAVEEEVDGLAEHAVAALDCARDAVELASNTQDRRLLAAVHTWLGLTLSNTYFNMRDRAHEAMERAATFLGPGVRDYIWEDFQMLKKRLLEDVTLESKLIQWAQGEIGAKTFRELEEDFADLVIPRAWDQEKRKISRVATRLSISPKKVRRVLTRLGLLEADVHGDEEKVTPLRRSKVSTMKKNRHEARANAKGLRRRLH